MDATEIAGKALEILDRDGWCKGAATLKSIIWNNTPQRIGSHCIGGAWALAAGTDFHVSCIASFMPLIQVIRDQHPDLQVEDMFRENEDLENLRTITRFNDLPETLQDDVRAILEKIAAG